MANLTYNLQCVSCKEIGEIAAVVPDNTTPAGVSVSFGSRYVAAIEAIAQQKNPTPNLLGLVIVNPDRWLTKDCKAGGRHKITNDARDVRLDGRPVQRT